MYKTEQDLIIGVDIDKILQSVTTNNSNVWTKQNRDHHLQSYIPSYYLGHSSENLMNLEHFWLSLGCCCWLLDEERKQRKKLSTSNIYLTAWELRIILELCSKFLSAQILF